MSVRRRFIAGAKCPHCQAVDKVRACREDEREWMECVSCGYSEARPTEVTPVHSEADEKDDSTGVVLFKNRH